MGADEKPNEADPVGCRAAVRAGGLVETPKMVVRWGDGLV